MNPNIQVFIKELRRGADCEDAGTAYYWASMTVPFYPSDADRLGVPYAECPMFSGITSAIAKGYDAFREGGSDSEIEQAFKDGMRHDREAFGLRYRVMRKDERPHAGDLLHAMPKSDRDKAVEILGAGFVAKAFARRSQFVPSLEISVKRPPRTAALPFAISDSPSERKR